MSDTIWIGWLQLGPARQTRPAPHDILARRANGTSSWSGLYEELVTDASAGA